jgi:dipeptidyl aminopeptidase/acylaminoacyl peptidase
MMQAQKLSLSMLVLGFCACTSQPSRPTARAPARAQPKKRAKPNVRREGPLVLDGIPRTPERIRRKLGRYLSARRTRFADWERHRGGMLVLTRFSDTRQVFRVGQPAGVRRQLTFFDDPVGVARFEPSSYDGSVLLLKDDEGREANQLFRAVLLEGSIARLSPGGQSRTTRFCVADDATIAFNSTARNGRDYDIYLAKPGDKDAKLVYEASGLFVPLDFSPDKSELLLLEIISRNQSRLHRLDLSSGQARRFEPHLFGGRAPSQPNAPVAYRDALWTADGREIIYASDAGSQFVQLYLYQLPQRRVIPLTADLPHDVEQMTISLDGRTLAFTTNEEGYSALHLLSVGRRRHIRVPLEKVVITDLGFSRDRRRASLLGLTIARPTGPSESFAYDIRRRRLSMWVEGEVGGLNSDFFVEPNLVRYPTFDQVDGEPRTIPAFFYKPPGPGPHPVLVHFHSAPEGQYRPRFDPLFQYLVMDKGVAVIAPNVRGSSGYGKSYLRLDDGRKRMDAVRDIGALLDWIAGQPELDASKVVVRGASYGGFLALAAMARYGKRIRGGIDEVGISSFLSFLGNTSPYRRALRRAEYGDERDPKTRAFLERISPLARVAKITAPLLVIQGANDPRVPRAESARLVRALRAKRRKVWYLLARNEGHRFRRKSNRDAAHFILAHFLESLGVGKGAPE